MSLFSQQAAQLSIHNTIYRTLVSDLLQLLYKSDLGSGDLTTDLLGRQAQIKTQATVRAKQSGLIAGISEVKFFWRQQGIKVSSFFQDGARVQSGATVLRLNGPAQAILTTERTALNLLQRLSGIATATDRLVQKVGQNKIAATRKTPWGLLDCRAVLLGGGLPHRLSLADQILIKDNHLVIQPNCWQKISDNQPFIIEAQTSVFAIQLARYFAYANNCTLLLDNFTPARLRALVLKLRTLSKKIKLEASGGITVKNVRAFLATGVDYVSLGSLTHSSTAFDFSLKIDK